MFKIKVISNNNVTNSAVFLTENECMNWYNSEASRFPTGHSYNIQSTQAEVESIQAKKYLTDTDWYIIREMDNGVTCPQNIKDARAIARTKVI